jgi:cytochrome c-type biogenesis protein
VIGSLDQAMQNIDGLTPFTVGLVALAGLVVGVAPSSFPLISVAAGLALGQNAAPEDGRHIRGVALSAGFALGVATVDALLGALFGLFGFAVLRLLVHYLAFAYALFAVFMLVAALALLRVIHIVVPTLAPASRPARSFGASYVLGIPFGLSTCPACTPLLLPVVASAAATADPLLGAVLMGTFGIARGVPIVAAATMAGSLPHLTPMRRYTIWVERIGATLMLGAALFFFYQAGLYAGWLRP